MFERSDSIYITIEPEKVPQYFLYIPFSYSEDNAELYALANAWREAERMSARPDKTPKIVIHKKAGEFLGNSDYEDVIFEFKINEIPKDSIIYILAHGSDDPSYVFNKESDVPLSLLVSDMVNRLISDGFTDDLAKKIKCLSLYSCDSFHFAKYYAFNTALKLGHQYSFLNINYYRGIISIPRIANEKMISHKFVAKPVNNNAITFGTQANIIKILDQDYEILGRAKDFKFSVNVGDVLDLHDVKESKEKSKTTASSGGVYTNDFSVFSQNDKKDDNNKPQATLGLYRQ